MTDAAMVRDAVANTVTENQEIITLAAALASVAALAVALND